MVLARHRVVHRPGEGFSHPWRTAPKTRWLHIRAGRGKTRGVGIVTEARRARRAARWPLAWYAWRPGRKTARLASTRSAHLVWIAWRATWWPRSAQRPAGTRWPGLAFGARGISAGKAHRYPAAIAFSGKFLSARYTRPLLTHIKLARNATFFGVFATVTALTCPKGFGSLGVYRDKALFVGAWGDFAVAP